MPQFVGQLLQPRKDDAIKEPSPQDYETRLHAAKLGLLNKSPFAANDNRETRGLFSTPPFASNDDQEEDGENFESRTAPNGDDYEIITSDEYYDEDDSDYSVNAVITATQGNAGIRYIQKKMMSFTIGLMGPFGVGIMINMIKKIFKSDTVIEKIKVDQRRCWGKGVCCNVAADAFELNKNSVVVPKNSWSCEDADVMDAAKYCCGGVIKLYDLYGNEIEI